MPPLPPFPSRGASVCVGAGSVVSVVSVTGGATVSVAVTVGVSVVEVSSLEESSSPATTIRPTPRPMMMATRSPMIHLALVLIAAGS